MKVNEVKETREVVVKTEYIAIDGTVFRTKEECEQWEKSYECTLTCSMKKIPHIETNGEDAYLQCGNCDDEVWIIKPRDFEDIKVINAYTEATCCGCKANLTQEDIGKLIAMNFGYDHDWCGIYKVDEYLNSIKKRIRTNFIIHSSLDIIRMIFRMHSDVTRNGKDILRIRTVFLKLDMNYLKANLILLERIKQNTEQLQVLLI